ncbi:uncharacterized protein LOC123919457 [Trifolium pratense]|nr:uncharacterized protein LOC123919457 [Trifolium pratense]
MENQPKTEPGLGSTDQTNMEAMSIQELVSVLRTAFLTEDFDKVEDVLVSRYNKLQTEILHLQEKFELEKLMRFQAEEDLMKREELCEKGKKAQNNYETLLKEVKKTSLVDRNIIGELRNKNDELELEVCELRKLKKRWMDDTNALSELIHKRSKDAQGASSSSGMISLVQLEVCELKKLKKKWVDEYSNGLSEPVNKRSKDAQGASSSSVTTQTREATIDAAHFGHGYSTTNLSRESAARHAPIVENDSIHVLEEVIATDSVVVPPSDVQEQMVTQNKAKRKRLATNASSNSFDNFHFISLVHQERYSELQFKSKNSFVFEKNFRLEGDQFSDIQAMIVARGWVELVSFAKESSTTLAKEFFANAYQGPAKEDGNDKNDQKQFTSFVRGKRVPFDDKVINQLFGLENYEQCSFEARKGKGSNIDHQEIHSTLCRPETDWIRNKDGTPAKLRTGYLTPNAKAWAAFVLHTLLPCSDVCYLTVQKATLVTAILKGEPVNVGRLLADDLWSTANSGHTSYLNHASLISKLCERVKVYPEMNEEMVMPSLSINAKWIEKKFTVSKKIPVHPHKLLNVGYNI